MRISELQTYGIPGRIIRTWQERIGETLLPVQEKAIRNGLLDNCPHQGESRSPNRMIITAPTSSGKSFCAELAAVKALTQRKKSVLLFPLKSIAEEKFRHLKATYEPLGVKCLIATGDHPDHDQQLARGDYQIAVAIYEKIDLLLCSRLDALANIGLVVIDELQMLAEPGRGAILERLITKILVSGYNPDILALSAVISDGSAGELAGWLGARLVTEQYRPVDLESGVVANGSFKYRRYNSGEEGELPFQPIEPGEDAQEAFIEQLVKDDRSTLLFLKSRADTINLAFRLASTVSYAPAKKALESLADEEPSYLVRTLKQALNRGIAFHNSDLSARQRAIVEQAFVDKEIKVVCSTTTLSMGINLPADTVYLETVKYSSGTFGGRPSLVPVSRSEFENMAGRAGRMGLNNGRSGRAIILAENEFDRDILWDQYIKPAEPTRLESAAETLPLDDWLLHLVASGLARTEGDIKKLLGRTFKATTEPDWFENYPKSLVSLEEYGLISRGRRGRLTIRPAGRVAAQFGLSRAEVTHLLSQLAEQTPTSRLGWLALVLSSSEWAVPPGLLSRSELVSGGPLRLFYERIGQVTDEISPLVDPKNLNRPLEYRQAAALKAILLLDDWCRLLPVQKLEERYQIHLGQIVTLGSLAAHYLAGLAALIEAEDTGSSLPGNLRREAYSVKHGLPMELQALYGELSEILNRSDLGKLLRQGVTSLTDLAELSGEELLAILDNPRKILNVNEKIGKLKQEVDMTVARSNGLSVMVAEPKSVELDGSYEQERYLIKIDGYPVRLTGKSFKYFARLAWSRLNRDSGWIYKDDIELGFNQARYMYRMKNEIKSFLPSDWGIVENNRLGYYRLDIPPEKIRINCENLKSHPDFEVRSLFKESGLSGPADSSSAVH